MLQHPIWLLRDSDFWKALDGSYAFDRLEEWFAQWMTQCTTLEDIEQIQRFLDLLITSIIRRVRGEGRRSLLPKTVSELLNKHAVVDWRNALAWRKLCPVCPIKSLLCTYDAQILSWKFCWYVRGAKGVCRLHHMCWRGFLQLNCASDPEHSFLSTRL